MGISFNKEHLVTGGGLASDFHGKQVSLMFGPYDFPNKDGESQIQAVIDPTTKRAVAGREAGRNVLTMRAVIQPYTGSGRDPDPSNLPGLNDDGQVVVYYGMGKYAETDLFLPSKDGVNPVDVDASGEELWGHYLVYADPELRKWVAENPGQVPPGAPRLSAGTKMNLALTAAQEATSKEYDDSLEVYEGVYGRWQLIDMPERKQQQSGIRMGRKQKEGYKDQYLALVQVVPEPKGGAPKGEGKGKVEAKGSSAKKASGGAGVNGSGDEPTGDGPTPKQRLSKLIVKELAKADGPVKADAIRNVIMETYEKGKAKSQALELLEDEDFLDSSKWNYNVKTETFTAVEE